MPTEVFFIGVILFVCFVIVLSIFGIKEWSKNNSQTFLTSDNVRKTFDLSTFDYEWIKEGDSWELMSQGTRFIKFIKAEKDGYGSKMTGK